MTDDSIMQIGNGFAECIAFEERSLRRKGSATLTQDAYLALIYSLKAMQESDGFWRGDAYNLGQKIFGDEFIDQIFEPGSWDVKTWQNNASVCSRIEPERRREKPVEYSHHAEVAYIPPADQDRLLDLVATGQVTTVMELRAMVKALKAGADEDQISLDEELGGPLKKLLALQTRTARLTEVIAELGMDWFDVEVNLETAEKSIRIAAEFAVELLRELAEKREAVMEGER